MKILNDEQKNYLKGLDSKKKRRKFMLDCLVESVIGESVKLEKFSYLRSGSLFIKEGHHFKLNDEVVVTDDFGNSKKGIVKRITNPDGFSIVLQDVSWDGFDSVWVNVEKVIPFYQTTTAPRTISESLKERQEYGSGNFDFGKSYVEAMDKITPKYELLKFDMLEFEEFEKEIKNNLLVRGFSPSQILNNRGLIGATIQETMSKINESANSEKDKFKEKVKDLDSEKKWTDDDFESIFIEALYIGIENSKKKKFEPKKMFQEYLKSLKNE